MLQVSPPLHVVHIPQAQRFKVRPGAYCFRREALTPFLQAERDAKLAQIQGSRQTWRISKDSVLESYSAPVANLPQSLEGLGILFIADTHLSRRAPQRARELSSLVNLVNSIKKRVDVVVLGGDLIERHWRDIDNQCYSALRRLPPNAIRMFLLGNHDFNERSAGRVRGFLQSLGFHDLTNQHVRLTVDEQPLNFFGLDDRYCGKPQLAQNATSFGHEVNLLFTHNLDAVTRHIPDCFDLMFSGHYHGGEIHCGPINGSFYLALIGEGRNINRQISGWDALSDRALSFVSPGLARHFPLLSKTSPGATIITLTNGRADQ